MASPKTITGIQLKMIKQTHDNCIVTAVIIEPCRQNWDTINGIWPTIAGLYGCLFWKQWSPHYLLRGLSNRSKRTFAVMS